MSQQDRVIMNVESEMAEDDASPIPELPDDGSMVIGSTSNEDNKRINVTDRNVPEQSPSLRPGSIAAAKRKHADQDCLLPSNLDQSSKISFEFKGNRNDVKINISSQTNNVIHVSKDSQNSYTIEITHNKKPKPNPKSNTGYVGMKVKGLPIKKEALEVVDQAQEVEVKKEHNELQTVVREKSVDVSLNTNYSNNDIGRNWHMPVVAGPSVDRSMPSSEQNRVVDDNDDFKNKARSKQTSNYSSQKSQNNPQLGVSRNESNSGKHIYTNPERHIPNPTVCQSTISNFASASADTSNSKGEPVKKAESYLKRNVLYHPQASTSRAHLSSRPEAMDFQTAIQSNKKLSGGPTNRSCRLSNEKMPHDLADSSQIKNAPSSSIRPIPEYKNKNVKLQQSSRFTTQVDNKDSSMISNPALTSQLIEEHNQINSAQTNVNNKESHSSSSSTSHHSRPISNLLQCNSKHSISQPAKYNIPHANTMNFIKNGVTCTQVQGVASANSNHLQATRYNNTMINELSLDHASNSEQQQNYELYQGHANKAQANKSLVGPIKPKFFAKFPMSRNYDEPGTSALFGLTEPERANETTNNRQTESYNYNMPDLDDLSRRNPSVDSDTGYDSDATIMIDKIPRRFP